MPKSDKNTSDNAQNDDIIIIKKYPNRRLYNTATSTYIVLDDLVELVKSGKPFEIRDTKSGDDITREILNQIIFERETGKSNFHFPLEVQKQLIGMYDDTYGKMMPSYLKEPRAIVKRLKLTQKIIRNLMKFKSKLINFKTV